MAKYDQIGIDYSSNRKSDPRIAEQIYAKLAGATSIVNIGAGAGSYEMENVDLTAVEPSGEMIAQRSATAHPAVQASAENLPFESKRFSHAMTVLSMHHWTDRPQAFREINRVTRERFVAVTWNPEAPPFWLTKDYFPGIYETDQKIFPFLSDFEAFFDDIQVSPLLIPEDCQDGFLAAYWKRPSAYLDPELRKSISTFSKLEGLEEGLQKLTDDLANGTWKQRNPELLDVKALDVGYIVFSAKIRD